MPRERATPYHERTHTGDSGRIPSLEEIELEVEVEAREFARRRLQERLQQLADMHGGVSPPGRPFWAARRRLYSAAMTEQTYDRLTTAEAQVKKGHSVILDATFARREHRELLAECFGRRGFTWRLLEAQASKRRRKTATPRARPSPTKFPTRDPKTSTCSRASTNRP